MRHWQHLERIATEELAVGPHFVGLGINLQMRHRAVELHVSFRNRPTLPHRRDALLQFQLGGHPRCTPAAERKVRLVEYGARPNDPNIGRVYTGCGVGIDAFGSPMAADMGNPP